MPSGRCGCRAWVRIARGRGVSFAQQRGQLGQHQAAEVGRQARLPGHGAFELAQGVAQPGKMPKHGLLAGQPRLEDAFQREEERLVRLGSDALAEIGIAALIVTGRQELTSRQDNRTAFHRRLANHRLQRVELQVPGRGEGGLLGVSIHGPRLPFVSHRLS